MTQERNYLIHPSYIIMILVFAGITALFIGFSGAYLYSRVQTGSPAIQLPSLFYYNALLLIGSGYTLKRAMDYYKSDQTKNYRMSLVLTLILTLAFLGAQVIAWWQLFNSEVFVNSSNMAAYMYLISGVHFAHVIVGIPFMAWFIIESVRKMKSPVSVLVYFSDPDKKRNLNLLTWYWHYLDGLWIYLVFFFLINYLIK